MLGKDGEKIRSREIEVIKRRIRVVGDESENNMIVEG